MRKMPAECDLRGQKFNKLTPVELVSRRPIRWKCLCECGNFTTVLSGNLRRGAVKSCGCLQHRGNPTHNLANTRQYRIYKKIMRRCYVPDDPAYKDYGGRGIDVCDEWRKSVVSFYNWSIQNGYAENLTIDRINNDKGYSPENCRWADPKQQSNNRRSNKLFTINGVTKNLAQWCAEYDADYKNTYNRVYVLGWDIETALTFKHDGRKVKCRKE